jgi:hypothetical protein
VTEEGARAEARFRTDVFSSRKVKALGFEDAGSSCEDVLSARRMQRLVPCSGHVLSQLRIIDGVIRRIILRS